MSLFFSQTRGSVLQTLESIAQASVCVPEIVASGTQPRVPVPEIGLTVTDQSVVFTKACCIMTKSDAFATKSSAFVTDSYASATNKCLDIDDGGYLLIQKDLFCIKHTFVRDKLMCIRDGVTCIRGGLPCI